MSTVVTCGSRAPVRSSQRRIRRRKSRSSQGNYSDWRFDHDLARGHGFRPSVVKLRPISYSRPRISFLALKARVVDFCRFCSGMEAMLTLDVSSAARGRLEILVGLSGDVRLLALLRSISLPRRGPDRGV